MTLSILPITSSPNQTFEVSLPIDSLNRGFKFLFSWNPVGQYWQFDLYDQNNNGELVLLNKPIAPIDKPYDNILLTYEYKEVGSLYVIKLGGGGEDRPGINNLGLDWVLVWGDTPYV